MIGETASATAPRTPVQDTAPAMEAPKSGAPTHPMFTGIVEPAPAVLMRSGPPQDRAHVGFRAGRLTRNPGHGNFIRMDRAAPLTQITPRTRGAKTGTAAFPTGCAELVAIGASPRRRAPPAKTSESPARAGASPSPKE